MARILGRTKKSSKIQVKRSRKLLTASVFTDTNEKHPGSSIHAQQRQERREQQKLNVVESYLEGEGSLLRTPYFKNAAMEREYQLNQVFERTKEVSSDLLFATFFLCMLQLYSLSHV